MPGPSIPADVRQRERIWAFFPEVWATTSKLRGPSLEGAIMRWVWITMVVAPLLVPRSALAGEYAPLDCAKASSSTQHAICESYALGQLEARMATLYGVATSLVAMGQRGDIEDAQRTWLKTRDTCDKRVSCLTTAYEDRIRALNDVVAGVASRGPF
jgi:uncharacterized protein